ncbi:ANR family transcriptional regulator [Martelella alba]|uniref:ANR family transcriptional regulator n=1 Tax=Martelella alba TaxID=2590451 RepID=A0ABY2SRC0_9HYPH|nr:ANR family transcriptional regulator [Martelella alba]TKI08638.1 ANR family transcriptional regulator [Martelella alba]
METVNRTQLLLAYLKTHGPATLPELSHHTSVDKTKVAALLAYHIKNGSVVKQGIRGSRLYGMAGDDLSAAAAKRTSQDTLEQPKNKPDKDMFNLLTHEAVNKETLGFYIESANLWFHAHRTTGNPENIASCLNRAKFCQRWGRILCAHQ